MESETKEQFDESSARVLTNIGFGLSVVAVLLAALVARFVAGVWVVAATLGLVAMVCGLAARDKSGRAGQWHGLAGTAAVLGGVAIIAALMSQI